MRTYDELMTEALDTLKLDDDIFVDMVNALDSWNGYADGFRAYEMYMLDEFFGDTKLTDFLDKLGRDFDHNDEYFVDTIYGIESTNDIADHYRDNVDEGDLLDEIIDHANNIYFYDSDFEDLINDIINYTEEEEEEPEETEQDTDTKTA